MWSRLPPLLAYVASALVTSVAIVALAVVPASAVPASAAPAPIPPPASAAVGDAWRLPLDGDAAVTRPFEQLPHPYAAGHRGVDLAGSPAALVRAAGDGVVVFAGWVAGRPVVSIAHAEGLRTTYEPVDASVAAGQEVIRGSPIGTLAIGHAGCPVQACLHWGLRRGETYLDPVLLLRPPRVRLLPLGTVAGPGVGRPSSRGLRRECGARSPGRVASCPM
jgi:murein DD-endopeptidase MepM/ murein hydrolase activator NlpD